jgi:hypothetical protein
MKKLQLVLLFVVAMVILPVRAQDSTPAPSVDRPGNYEILYDDLVSETITDGAFFDWWRIQAEVGDILVIDLVAADGLVPFVAILDSDADSLITSDPNALANGQVALEYAVSTAGTYTIVVTRVGVNEGTSVGSYTLSLRNAGSRAETPNNYQETSFQCAELGEAINLVRVQLQDDPVEGLTYRFTVYGLDGLEPVIRLRANPTNANPINDCSADETGMGGDVVRLGEGTSYTVPTTISNPNVGRLVIRGAQLANQVDLTIGALNNRTGRYILLIEGLSIQDRSDIDSIVVQPGPRTATAPTLLYMLQAFDSRVDPFVEVLPILNDDPIITCDDVGRRRGCPDILPLGGFTFADGSQLNASRFDAGITIPLNFTAEGGTIELLSRGNNTEGAYAVVLMGALR